MFISSLSALRRRRFINRHSVSWPKFNFLRHQGVKERSKIRPVRSKYDDTKESFPRRALLYGWISRAAPGDVVVIVYSLVALTILGVIITAPDSLPCDTDVDGLSLLGVFSLITFSVERFLDPLKAFLDTDTLSYEEADKFSRSLSEVVDEVGGMPQSSRSQVLGTVAKMRNGVLGDVAEKIVQGVPERRSGDAQSRGLDDEDVHTARTEKALQTAKTSEINVARIKATTSVIFWGLASCISMILSEAAGVGIMHVTGLTNVSVPLDIVITGFAVGAGTKPLNSLLSQLER